MGYNQKSDFLEIPNPYTSIPTCVSKVGSFLQTIENHEISNESFYFSDKFKLLSSFIDYINNKGLNENELQELTKIWNSLMMKGYLLNQITLKFDEDEISNVQSTQSFNIQLLNGFCVIPIYFNCLISFILDDPPGDTYNELLRKLIIFYQKNSSTFLIERPRYPKSLENVNELNTLKQQKYYIVWYLIDYLYHASKDPELSWDDFCLILSLLPWIVDADCKEARDLEEHLSKIVRIGLQKYDYNERRTYSLKPFAKFIINTINKSNQPLNPDDLKQKLEGMKNGESNGGCCTIQ